MVILPVVALVKDKTPLTPVAGQSADVREDPAKSGGESVRIAMLSEAAVVAREDHRLGPKSLRHGQRGAIGERSL